MSEPEYVMFAARFEMERSQWEVEKAELQATQKV